VHSHVDIYNFSDNTWGGRFDMPKDMAHSHLGMVTDGRFIYVVTGQYGPQCRGPTARNFVLDTETKEWNDLPPLPVPRYYLYFLKLGVHALCIYALLALESCWSHVGQGGAQVPPWNKFTEIFVFHQYCICNRCIEVCTTIFFLTVALPLILLLQILSEYLLKQAVNNLNKYPSN
jgi:hypothetical protein